MRKRLARITAVMILACSAGALPASAAGVATLPAPTTFAMGYEGFACGLKSGHTVTCWGQNWGWSNLTGISDAVSVGAGGSFACVLRANGQVPCSGYNWSGVIDTSLDVRQATSISVGGGHACATVEGGDAVCWGWDDFGQSRLTLASGAGASPFGFAVARPRPFGFTDVAQIVAGGSHTCVLSTSGTVRCWGNNEYGQSEVPGELAPVTQVAASDFNTCVVLVDGAVRCWGSPVLAAATPAMVDVVKLRVGPRSACALLANGEVNCWGSDYAGTPVMGHPSVGPVVDVFPGGDVFRGNPSTCALLADGKTSCWGSDQFSVFAGAAANGPFEVPLNGPGKPVNLTATAADGAVVVSWRPGAQSGQTQVAGYTVTASPGGQTCNTSGLSCTVTGLTNRQRYTFTVTATNSAGESASSEASSTVMPLAAGFQAWPADSVLALGGSTTLRFAQASAGASIAVTGSTTASLTADSAGFASASFTVTKAGIQKFTASYSVRVGKKTTKYTTTAQLYVPSLSGPLLKIKQGKSGKFSLQFMPPGAAILIALSDGRTLTGIADSFGKASVTATFTSLGALTYTASVAGVQIGTGGLTVTR